MISPTSATREDLETSGYVIGREVKDATGNTFLRLDKDGENCLVMRSQKHDRFILVDIYTLEKANKFLDRMAQN